MVEEDRSPKTASNSALNAETPSQEKSRSKTRKRLSRFFRSQVWDWIKIILIILVIKGCVIDQYTIPSGSMEPTLHGDPNFLKGDRVLVNKWIYGPRIPFTTIRLWDWEQPERWDIVVFKAAEGQSEHHTLVKRVVGLPGEEIHIENGRPVIDGQVIEPPEEIQDDIYYYNDEDLLWEAQHAQSPRKREFFLSLRSQYPYRYGVIDEPEYTKIPEGHYLMLGDNSLNSIDGRHYGWVSQDNLLGPVFAIWWPWSHRRDFSGFSQTWWGQGLLYGLPVLLIGWEFYGYFRERRRRALAEQEHQDKPPTDK